MLNGFLWSHAGLRLYLFHTAFDDASQLVGLFQLKHSVPASGAHADGNPSRCSVDNCFHNRIVFTFYGCKDTNKRAKMQINLQFSEREYLRGKASEISNFRDIIATFPSEFYFRPPCILLPALNREGQGEGLYIRLSQYVKERFEAGASQGGTSPCA